MLLCLARNARVSTHRVLYVYTDNILDREKNKKIYFNNHKKEKRAHSQEDIRKQERAQAERCSERV